MSSKIEQELKRVLLYAKGLNVRVRIANYSYEDAGMWGVNPDHEISINKKKHTSTTELIMTILHELGHAMHFKYTGKPIPDLSEKPTKTQRRKLYEYEKAGIEYMLTIWTELELSIPRWKIERQIEFDVYQYHHFYQIGRYPNKLERKAMFKQLTEKYKVKTK